MKLLKRRKASSCTCGDDPRAACSECPYERFVALWSEVSVSMKESNAQLLARQITDRWTGKLASEMESAVREYVAIATEEPRSALQVYMKGILSELEQVKLSIKEEDLGAALRQIEGLILYTENRLQNFPVTPEQEFNFGKP